MNKIITAIINIIFLIFFDTALASSTSGVTTIEDIRVHEWWSNGVQVYLTTENWGPGCSNGTNGKIVAIDMTQPHAKIIYSTALAALMGNKSVIVSTPNDLCFLDYVRAEMIQIEGN